MTDIHELNTCKAEEFYNVLHDLKGISPLYQKIHELLCEMQNDLSEHAKKVLYLYFALLEDGNTRLALDSDQAWEMWKDKWNALVRMAQIDGKIISLNGKDIVLEQDDCASVFKPMLSDGIKDILNSQYNQIIERRESNTASLKDSITKPFVIASDGKLSYLYATRYFDAKCVIEDKCKTIFKDINQDELTSEDLNHCQKFFRQYLNENNKGFTLEERQKKAILCGQNHNLIITGGPGTGKTTVICFLLWKLLAEHVEMQDWDIKLAAPSGKAADRMRESLLGSLEKLKKQSNPHIYKKLQDLESFTLHRLLSYNPGKNQFKYNAENPFPAKMIFVIDEASMIDIDLFARFMEALPESDCRVFILGDPDQLPSVEAGAVLGEMLKTGEQFTIRLNKSKRFDMDSDIGRLSIAIQNAKPRDTQDIDKQNITLNEIKPNFKLLSGVHLDPCYPETPSQISGNIHYFTLNEEKKEVEKDLKKLTHAWVNHFYIKTQYIEKATAIQVGTDNQLIDTRTNAKCDTKVLNELWDLAQKARILSAERKGLTGVVTLNELVKNELQISSSEPFFVGQLLMLTENQSTLKLYNGDCGIVIGEVNSGRLHLLLRKVVTKMTSKDDKYDIGYVTYPLSLLPTDALESAFAMTIHKSQGSGYANIMMFLPQTVGHPLLNNQMIYTGVTRTERQSLTIVANQVSFQKGCEKSIKRDTGIDISIKM